MSICSSNREAGNNKLVYEQPHSHSSTFTLDFKFCYALLIDGFRLPQSLAEEPTIRSVGRNPSNYAQLSIQVLSLTPEPQPASRPAWLISSLGGCLGFGILEKSPNVTIAIFVWGFWNGAFYGWCKPSPPSFRHWFFLLSQQPNPQ